MRTTRLCSVFWASERERDAVSLSTHSPLVSFSRNVCEPPRRPGGVGREEEEEKRDRGWLGKCCTRLSILDSNDELMQPSLRTTSKSLGKELLISPTPASLQANRAGR